MPPKQQRVIFTGGRWMDATVLHESFQQQPYPTKVMTLVRKI